MVVENTARKAKRIKKCGICKPCLVLKDCKSCRCCKNRKKGKQICVKRKCLLIIQAQKLRTQKKVFFQLSFYLLYFIAIFNMQLDF